MSLDGESYINSYLTETSIIASQIDHRAISALVDLLDGTRMWMRTVYVLGLGGSLANASHLAADLRQRTRLLAQAPESLPELTALSNDVGWANMLAAWLASRVLRRGDVILVLSVGGGSYPDPETSLPLVNAMLYARTLSLPSAGIVGEPGGTCAEMCDVVVKIPSVAPERKTEHCEGWQGVIHHLIVGHPRLRRTG